MASRPLPNGERESWGHAFCRKMLSRRGAASTPDRDANSLANATIALVPASMSRIGILAGGGRLPLMIAESAAARGEAVHIVGIDGEADPAIARFPHSWVNWGQIGRMVAILHDQGGRRMVIAGGVTRPD